MSKLCLVRVASSKFNIFEHYCWNQKIHFCTIKPIAVARGATWKIEGLCSCPEKCWGRPIELSKMPQDFTTFIFSYAALLEEILRAK